MGTVWIGLALLLASGAPDRSLPMGPVVRLGAAVEQEKYAAVSAVFSPDGKFVAWVTTGTGERATVSVHVWDVASRKERCRCVFTAEAARATTEVAIADRGRIVLLGTYHEQGGPARSARNGVARIRAWDATTGKELERFEGIRTDETGDFRSLAVSGDGKSVVTQRVYGVQTWDLATGKRRREFAIGNEDEGGFAFQALSPVGGLLAYRLNNDPVRLWDVAAGKRRHELKAAGAPLAVSADGKRVATCDGRKVLIWDAVKGAEMGRLDGAAVRAAFTADGRRVACSEKGGKVRVAEVGGKEVVAFDGTGGPVAFAADGRRLATVCTDGTLLLWPVPVGR